MTQEEKAKAYDEAIKRAKKEWSNNLDNAYKNYRERLEIIFPELKESEDEKVRKSIIAIINNYVDNSNTFKPKMLAWLEKQGQQKYIPKYRIGDYVKNTNYKGEPIYEIIYMDKECYICEYRGKERMGDKAVMHFSFDNPYLCLVQKPTDNVEPKFKVGDFIIKEKSPAESLGISPEKYEEIVNECIYGEEKPVDKVEPKFHEGDWITNGYDTWKIVEVKPLDYILQSQDGNIVDDTISYVDGMFDSFTVQDAKDGDVLHSPSHRLVWIYKDNEHYHASINLNYANVVSFDNEIVVPSDVCPANRVQRSILFQKMEESNYKWDAEKKELRKIEKQGERTPPQTNECAWLHLVSDVLTWKDGIGQYLDDPRVQELAKKLCSEYAQKLYNSSVLSNLEKTGKNDTLLDLIQKIPSCITADGIDYHFVMTKHSYYIAYYKAIGEEGRGNAIFGITAFSPIDLLTEMLEKLKKEGLLE